jgi:NADH dehydrogenase
VIVAITGGTGFVGRHLAERLRADGVRSVVVSRRTGAAIDDADALTRAFTGCDTVVHCAGINREIGDQTFERVHIEGTRAVIDAARQAGVTRVVMLSFLRARPGTRSPYHETKWRAEELLRTSGLDYTIVKAGMIYGRGDHLVDHLSHTVHTLPLFATVGFREKPIRPVPVDDLTRILQAAALGRLPRQTVAVTGAEELLLSDAVRRVARVVGRRILVVPAPVLALEALGQLTEWTMRVPLVAKAQVRMLAEGVAVPLSPAALTTLPVDLVPRTAFSDAEIRRALPPQGRFTVRDLRCARRRPAAA